jgi:hypothetical protein
VQAEERDLGVTPSSLTSPMSDNDASELTLKTPVVEAVEQNSICAPPERPHLREENRQTGSRLAQFRQDSLEQQVPSIYGPRQRRAFRLATHTSVDSYESVEPPLPLPLSAAVASAPNTFLSETEWQMRETELRRQLLQSLREKDELRDRIRILERRVKEPP